ncbi:MAG TPA: glycosyltransferase [Solirubrobacteraceae bacterium]|nr:glycosyltransferase [Solirubrobacteraceae bacterium]
MLPPVPVLTLIDSVHFDGGAERLAVELATRLDRTRYAPLLCVTRGERTDREPAEEAAVAQLREAGVPVLWLERGSRADLLVWRRFVATLRRRRVGVLHAHKFGSNVWGAVMGSLAGVPAVVSHEHTWAYDDRRRMLLDRHVVARGSDAVIAVSTEDRRRMIELEGMPAARVRYIPNGIVTPAPGDGARVRAELGLADDVPLVGAIGTMRPQKAFEVLVDAAATLRERVPGVRVAIVGEGPEQERLAAQVEALGLSDTVLLLGYRADVPDVLHALDVVVNCSDFEGQPLAILEAMEAARPIVATRVGGTPDLLDDGVHALLVSPRDPAAVAEAVERLLADRGAARALGERARARRRDEFDIARTVARVEDLYAELLAAKGVGVGAGASASARRAS